MKGYKLITQLGRLCWERKIVDKEAIGEAYTAVSEHYEDLFLKEMHTYNDQLLASIEGACKGSMCENGSAILDLACGTGYNSVHLASVYPDAIYTLVDVSEGMLGKAKEKQIPNATYIQKDMLGFLRAVPDASFDKVICCWAIKYQPPKEVIREVHRILKPGGVFGVLVNTKETLAEVRKIYPGLLMRKPECIRAIMKELPNPKNEKMFTGWFKRAGFKVLEVKENRRQFVFDTQEEQVYWITHTGALAGFDCMIDLKDEAVQNEMIRLFKKKQINTITHTFVWGVFEKEGARKA